MKEAFEKVSPKAFYFNFTVSVFGRKWAGALNSVSSPVCEGQESGFKGTNGNPERVDKAPIKKLSSQGWEEKVGELSSLHI